MTRLFALIMTVAALTGCSEMRVIGNAAMRELRADGYNVEQISYNYHQKLAAQGANSGVLMAKADTQKITADGRVSNADKKPRLTKSRKVRGLWESETARLEARLR